MQPPLLSHKASRFTESVIRGMSIEAVRSTAPSTWRRGCPTSPRRPRSRRPPAGPSRPTSTSTPSPGARGASARRSPSTPPGTSAWTVDPETEITVTCGSTEAMLVALLSLINPGDEVILSQPFYENYWPDCVLAGATPAVRPASARPAGPSTPTSWPPPSTTGPRRSSSATRTTRPAPSSRRDDLEAIAALCRKWDVIAITDEIYEHIVYDGRPHVALASLDGMRERSVTIGGMSKTYAVTGWRVGTMIAPPRPDARLPPGPRLRLDRRRRPAAGGRRVRLPAAPRLLRPARRRLPGPPRPPLLGPDRGRLRPRAARRAPTT